jgi:thiamine pyrophosphokinase
LYAAHYKVCADGGANHIRDKFPSTIAPPDAIVGDLDSIRTDVRGAYSEMGIPIIDLSADQETTDLEKCVHHIRQQIASQASSEATSNTIVVLGVSLPWFL